jgi:serine/threonine-protein kinase
MADLRSLLEQALADRYRIQRELGHGGMGLVFLAEDLKHGRKVALKVLRPEVGQSLGGDRFLREIRITAQLNHPNILTLIDSGEADGFTYYVLPYVEGESLRERLDREKQLPLEDALRITGEVADALGYAHSLGVVHRDIKPENILFEAGHAVVTDFGIAKAISEAGGEKLTQSGLAVGTPAYMSPEQATGAGDPDARSDLYSLACVLYEMLASAPPYSGPSAQAILARKALDPVPGLRVVRDTVPLGVERAVMRALAKVPADRFTTARQFVEALSGTGAAIGAPSRVLAFARSRLVAMASVIVVVAAAGYVVLALRGGAGTDRGLVAASFARLTVDPGVEWFPSLSPDGQWLLYSGEASGNRDIYLLRVGGQNPINLTEDSPEADDQPAISPDGEQIAFRSEREGGGIFVMGRTGEAVRRVTRFGYRPAWSPDGTQLAFATENMDLNPQNSETRGQLWVADVRTGKTRRLPVMDAALPSWSPHGRRIAFFQRLGQVAQGHVWTVPAAGGEPAAVTGGTTRNWSPAWSPDGQYLYFVSDRGGAMNLWRVRIDEESGRPLADPEPVTTPATSLAHVSVSADGKQLAYSSVLVTTNVQRAVFDPARGIVVGDPEWITRGSQRWANPDPSPDGESVVFYSLVEPEGHLYVMRVDGTGRPRQLTADSASDRVPRWSPDGDWIATFSDRSGPLQIWKVRPDGSGLAQVSDAPTNTAYAVWSPDGRRMAAANPSRDSGVTYLFDPNRPWHEQRPDVLPAPPDSLAPFGPHSWSPDGQRLAGMVAALDRGVVTYTFASRRYERLTDVGQWPVWLPDSRRVLFVSGGNAFYIVDRETRQVRQVFSVRRDVIGPPQLTRDGHAMYFSRRVTEADIWLVTLP